MCPHCVTSVQLSSQGEIRIAFVLYKHIGVYLSTENASMKLGSDAMATNYSVIVNSPVITAAINKDSNKVYLSDPVIFTIRHLQVIICVLLPLSFYLHTHTHSHFLDRTPSSQFLPSPERNKNAQILSQAKKVKFY